MRSIRLKETKWVLLSPEFCVEKINGFLELSEMQDIHLRLLFWGDEPFLPTELVIQHLILCSKQKQKVITKASVF